MPSVEYVRWARFRVTVTAFVGLAILTTLVILLTGGTLFEPQANLFLFLSDATGVAPGSPVRVDGIPVGKVTSVALSGSSNPNRIVKVTLTVGNDRLMSITEDSTAQTSSDTLVGDKFIQITSGASARRVQPGTEIKFKSAPDLTQSFDIADFRKQLAMMDALLTEIENGTSPLGQLVMGDQMYRDVRGRLGELDRTLRAAVSTTSSAGHEIYTDELYRQVLEPFAKLDETLAQLQSGQGSAGQFLRDNAQYDQLRSQIGVLRQSIVEVRGTAWMRSDAMYEEWNRNVAGWIRMVDEFNATPLLATTSVYDNLNGMAKELHGTLKEFREHPQKFLRLKVF